MFITRQFVFLHVPKTGGAFIRGVCEDHLPEGSIVELDKWEPHGSYDEIPSEFDQLPRLSFARNPWDWYVSWYHHTLRDAAERSGMELLFMWSALFDKGRNDFRQTLMAASGEQEIVPPSGKGPRWLQMMRELDVDFYTALHLMIVGREADAAKVEIGRFETLRPDFLDFVARHNVVHDGGLGEAVLTRPRVNTGDRREYQEYYDDELRDLVARRARPLIEEFGYSFENGA